MFTLHATHQTKTSTVEAYHGLVIATIAYNVMKAEGWIVTLSDQNGKETKPLSLAEFVGI